MLGPFYKTFSWRPERLLDPIMVTDELWALVPIAYSVFFFLVNFTGISLFFSNYNAVMPDGFLAKIRIRAKY